MYFLTYQPAIYYIVCIDTQLIKFTFVGNEVSVVKNNLTFKGILFPFAAVMTLCLAAIVGLVILVGQGQNRLALNNSKHLVKSIIDVRKQTIGNTVLEYGYWKEAVENIINEPNLDWIAANLGNPLFDTYGISASYAVAADNTVIYAASADGNDAPELFVRLPHRLETLLNQVRSADPASEPRPSAGMLSVNGITYLAAVSALTDYTNVGDQLVLNQTKNVLVLIQAMDAEFLANIESQFLVKDLQISPTRPDASGEAMMVLTTEAGAPTSYLSWSVATPGTTIMKWLVPAILGLLIIILCVGALFLKKLRNTTDAHLQMIEERENASTRLLQAQKMESLGNLAGGVAHHLNNLFLPILVLTGILQKRFAKDDPDHEIVEKVIESVSRASDIVDRILKFARTGSGELVAVNMYASISDSMTLVKVAHPSTVKINEDIDTDSGTIKADPAEVEVITLNLTSNAIDAMTKKQGTLGVSLKNIDVIENDTSNAAGVPPGDYVRLGISDTGCGMDDETKSRIFEPFFTTKEVGAGTGLGLAAVHGIVSGCGGFVTVDSAVGRGTLIEVYFPRIKELTDEADNAVN